MASDSMPDQEVNQGNNIHISIASPSLEEAERFFNNLAQGGNVILPFSEQFWEAKFGMLIDKFGVNWMVNCQLDKE